MVNVSPIVYAVPSAVIVIPEIFPSLPTTTVAWAPEPVPFNKSTLLYVPATCPTPT